MPLQPSKNVDCIPGAYACWESCMNQHGVCLACHGKEGGFSQDMVPPHCPITMKALTLGCITYSQFTFAKEIPTNPPKCIKKIKFCMLSQELELSSQEVLYADESYNNELEASTMAGNISRFLLGHNRHVRLIL